MIILWENTDKEEKKEKFKNALKAAAIGTGVAGVGSALVGMHGAAARAKHNAIVLNKANRFNKLADKLYPALKFDPHDPRYKDQHGLPYGQDISKSPGMDSDAREARILNKANDAFNKSLDSAHKSIYKHNLAKVAAVGAGAAAAYGAYKYLQNKKKKKKDLVNPISDPSTKPAKPIDAVK